MDITKYKRILKASYTQPIVEDCYSTFYKETSEVSITAFLSLLLASLQPLCMVPLALLHAATSATLYPPLFDKSQALRRLSHIAKLIRSFLKMHMRIVVYKSCYQRLQTEDFL
jgi:hypothetical protein